MAQKIGLWQGAFSGGVWSVDRDAINRNAEELEAVEDNLGSLRAALQRQADALTHMYAMIVGLVETLHAKQPFAAGELEAAVERAWKQLTAPPEATAAAERMVTCAKCLKKVPASRTNITATGDVCDRCS